MNYPKSVLEIFEEQAAKHANNIPAAVREAERLIRKLPEYADLVGILVHNAVQEGVYSARHKTNVRIKLELGDFGQPAKVVVGTSPGCEAAAKSVYDYNIGKTRLGLIYGRDLVAIAENEQAIGNGHFENAAICRKLQRLVPADKQVQDAVSERQLNTIFKAVKREINKAA